MDKCSIYSRGKCLARGDICRTTGIVYSKRGDEFETISSFFETEYRAVSNMKRCKRHMNLLGLLKEDKRKLAGLLEEDQENIF